MLIFINLIEIRAMQKLSGSHSKILLKIIPIHLLVWGGLFFINYLFLNNYPIEFDSKYHISIWLIYLVIFYINFLFLMPYFFFRKRFFIYVVSSLLILTGAHFIRSGLDKKHFEKIFTQERRTLNPDRPYLKNMPPPPLRPDNELPGMKEFRERPRVFRMPHFSFYSIFLIYLASISIRFIQKWQDDEKRNSEIDKERISNELLFLKQQVNPHFLFNALNNIYSMTISTSKPASEAILKLSSILRYMLYEADKKLVDLHDELNIISDYIELQKLRIADNVALNYQVNGEVKNQKITPLLLIPLIENAFKYGVDNIGNSFIEISISITDNKLKLLVSNQVVKQAQRMEKDSGIGIKNIKRRLDLLYPGKYSFKTEENQDIFTVLLNLEL